MNDINGTDNQNFTIIISSSNNRPIKFCYESSWEIKIKGDTIELTKKMTLEELMKEYDIYLDTEVEGFIYTEKYEDCEE